MMATVKKVHILDRNSARRAQINFTLRHGHIQTQIYEDLKEFCHSPPLDGLVLLNEDSTCPIRAVQQSLDASGTALPIAMFSPEPTTTKIVQAMLAGALDYLEFPFDVMRVERAMTKIESDYVVHMQRRRKQAAAMALTDSLSEREREVLKLLIVGQSNKGIAHELGISPRTVEVHRANMMVKLSARSSSDAVRIGIYAGLDDR